MNEKLELLSYADKYHINKKSQDRYEIFAKDTDIVAVINKNEITYYITGCYDSGIDWLEINMKAIEELKEFCNLMIKE